MIETVLVGLVGLVVWLLLRKLQQRTRTKSEPSTTIHVVGLRLYPVKSCAPVEVEEAQVTDKGFRFDRRFVIVDADTGKQVTQRKCPRMALVQPLIFPETNLLQLTARGVETTIRVPLELSSSSTAASSVQTAPLQGLVSDFGRIDVEIWGWRGPAAHMGPEAARWLTEVLERDVVLARQLDEVVRPCSDDKSTSVNREGDVVSFADGYPYLLTSMQSLAQLNQWIAEETQAPPHIQMRRFRPNIIVSGSQLAPWDEESWKSIIFRSPFAGRSDLRLTNQKLCGRCILTTVDPDKGELTKPALAKNGERKSGGEPLFTLLQRQKATMGAAYFGINLVGLNAVSQPLTVGSTVAVLERGVIPKD